MMWTLFASPALWRIVVLLTQVPPAVPGPEDNDFAPLIFVLIMALVCLVLLGIGMALALAGIACGAVLVMMGIVTSSAVVTVFRRRASAGVRAFHYQICAALGAPAGVTLLWAATALFGPPMRLRAILPLGALAGIVAGLAVAGLLDWAARTAYRRLFSFVAPT